MTTPTLHTNATPTIVITINTTSQLTDYRQYRHRYYHIAQLVT